MRDTLLNREKIIDDIARAAGEAVGLAQGLSRSAKTVVRSRIDDLAQRIDLVPREDFDRLEVMLMTAREEIESLKARLDTLEAQQKRK